MTKVAKVCFVGSEGAGKTSIILRFTRNSFSSSYIATMGCDFYNYTFPNHNDFIEVYLWDVGGQRNYELMRKHYLALTQLVVICFDVKRYTDEYITPWIKEVNQYTLMDSKIVFALNKIDLEPNPDQLNQVLSQLKSKYSYPIVLTSAKTGENVQALFELIQDMLR